MSGQQAGKDERMGRGMNSMHMLHDRIHSGSGLVVLVQFCIPSVATGDPDRFGIQLCMFLTQVFR